MVNIKVFDKEFQKAVDQTLKNVSDLTIPFNLITQSWFKSNRSIFTLGGPGKYADLSPGYKRVKQAEWGFTYPILKAKGDLMDSVTKPGDTNSIAQILNKKTLVLGSKDPKAEFHQLGTNRMPARPFVLLGLEQVAPPEVNRRREAWIKVLSDFAVQASSPLGKAE